MFRDVLINQAQQQGLRGRINEAIQQAHCGAYDREDLENVLRNAQEELNSMDDHVRAVLHERATTTGYTARSSELAKKVFGTGELLENIVQNLSIKDTLSVQAVNSTIFESIKHSPRVQQALHRSPDPKVMLRPLRNGDFEGLRTMVNFEPKYNELSRKAERSTADHNQLLVHVFFDGFLKPMSIGSRVGAMYICQPPITEMTIYCECCKHENENGTSDVLSNAGTLCCESGITIKDVYETTLRVAEEHSNCAYAHQRHFDEDGIVRPQVSFEAHLTLPCEYHVCKEGVQDRDEYDKENRERWAWQSRLWGFCSFRRARES